MEENKPKNCVVNCAIGRQIYFTVGSSSPYGFGHEDLVE